MGDTLASQAKHQYTLVIREFHLDSFGHVNHAKYLELFEEARWDLVTGRGYGYAEVQKTRLGPVILEAKLRYQKELRLRETVTITTQLLDYSSRVGTLAHEALTSLGQPACVAEVKFGLFDLEKRKLISPTPEFRRAIGLE